MNPTETNRDRKTTILIVGAGIGGLALARALRARGFRPEIIERVPDLTAVGGAGVYIPANGMRALSRLGLDQAVLARGILISRQRLLDHRGRLLAEVDLGRVWKSVGPCAAIKRTDLHAVLREGVVGTSVRCGRTVTSVAQTPNAVSVAFDDGTIREYDLLVGADGIQSAIRRLVIDGMPPRYRGQVSWRFIAPNVGGVSAWTAMLAGRRAFLMIPVDSRHVYCYADVTTRDPDAAMAYDFDRVRALFADFVEPVPDILSRLESLDAIHVSTIEEVKLDTPVNGRVVLVGDAAHATSPNMAEGVSMALEDALVLGELLAAGDGSPDVLATYSERRAPRIRWVSKRTNRRDRIRELPTVLRNLAIRLSGSVQYERDYRPLFRIP